MTRVDADSREDNSVVAMLAVRQLIDLFDILDDDEYLLTTHIGGHSSEPDEASSSLHDLNAAIGLLRLIEALPLYRLVERAVVSSQPSSVRKAGVAGQTSPSSPTEGCCDLPQSTEVLNAMMTSSHFLTMLLLSWPYHRCSSQTHGLILQKYVAEILALFGREPVDNESARLRQQLALILGYAKSRANSNITCSGAFGTEKHSFK